MTKSLLQNTLGAHREGNNVVFRVYAPGADRVLLTGDFCAWGDGYEMEKEEGGVFALHLVPNAIKKGDHYGYRIERDGKITLKNDPFATLSQPHSYGASRFYPISAYDWQDEGYLTRRKDKYAGQDRFAHPMLIYELHVGSFRPDMQDYRVLADFLSSYLPEMGFTHLELLPVLEHPYGGSWGYQVMSFFSPSARFGLPEDLMYLVDTLHAAHIGVIFDLPLAHFPRDEKGLARFDGTPLFEGEDEKQADLSQWGTLRFDLSSPFVRAFLTGAVMNLIETYHADAIRIDAVTAILFRDYGKGEGEWTREIDGGNVSHAGVSFLKELNQTVHRSHPDVFMIAEESSAFPRVTRKEGEEGLGFDLKWNMGFSNDLFAYLETDPLFRKYHHKALTFPILYAASERFLLPISHDEVVYGKRSLFAKIFGTDPLKEATFRAFYAFFLAFPGKKLLFMGSEFAQRNEWNWNAYIEFSQLAYPLHRRLFDFVRQAHHLYLSQKPLFECDFESDGFVWIDPDDKDGNAVSFKRFSKDGSALLCHFSFAGSGERTIFLPPGRYRILLDTTSKESEGTVARTSLTRTAPFALILSPISPPKRTKTPKKEDPT